jgi:hypothetical protein
MVPKQLLDGRAHLLRQGFRAASAQEACRAAAFRKYRRQR